MTAVLAQYLSSNQDQGSARGNWDPREGQQPFRPNPNGAGDRTTTLKRLLIGADFRTWVLTTYQFFYLSLSLRSFTPTSASLPSIFRKLAGMTLPPTLTLTVLLQKNTRLFLFPLQLLSLPLWQRMRPNLPFLSAASNALLKPGGLLRWKKRLVKDAGLLLLLTEVMKIARLTSPPLDVPRRSLPGPRLRHGRRPALLFHLNLILNLCTLFFALLLALLPRLPPLLTFLTVLLPGNRLRFMPLT